MLEPGQSITLLFCLVFNLFSCFFCSFCCCKNLVECAQMSSRAYCINRSQRKHLSLWDQTKKWSCHLFSFIKVVVCLCVCVCVWGGQSMGRSMTGVIQGGKHAEIIRLYLYTLKVSCGYDLKTNILINRWNEWGQIDAGCSVAACCFFFSDGINKTVNSSFGPN